MPASLSVGLNADRLHDIDVPPSFVAADTFTVDLENQGEAVHVHLHLDDTLSRVARLSANNHFVDAETTRPVEVAVRNVDEPITGKLKVVTGYGNETEYVEVTIEPAPEQKSPVAIDERLAHPQPSDPETSLLDRMQSVADDTTIPVVLVAGIAILLALGVGIAANSWIVLLTAAVVVLGVVGAVLFLLR